MRVFWMALAVVIGMGLFMVPSIGFGSIDLLLQPAREAHPGFKPQYLKVERTDAGADITYSCPCGSTTEVFHLDRSQADQAPHSCCGHHTLVGTNAAARLRARVGEGYNIDVQTITMPWGQPLEAAQAVRRK